MMDFTPSLYTMDNLRKMLVLLLLLITGEGVLGVRNCLLARQQCADDHSCRPVLEIIPRVCGPESVACSTVTVDKCLAALRFLQGFPYFQPTCLCREPHIDRECNVFREFIFDHPCIFVENKDESPYTSHSLPLCEYALNNCEKLPGCIKLYEEFRESCKQQKDQCRMEDTNKCLESWTKLKMSPMFGCVCPTDHQKKKCQKIFKIVHNNPCVGEASPAGPVIMLHSTCQTALTGCLGDQSCRRLLDPVLAVCDSSQCNREACMSNLQTFYRSVDSKWAIEVAFCLCKKSSQTADECLSAQEKLHPACARQPAGKGLMLCNRLAAACKEDKGCRHRLEFYEQACAVDSDTRRCAGSTAECRRALLGILGTQLRNLCTCIASDPRETYMCLDWQRILWFNPCVVEAQTDYHREMLAETNEEITTTPDIIITPSGATGIVGKPVQTIGGNSSPYEYPIVIHPPASTTTIYRFGTPWPPLPPTQPVMPTTTSTPAPTTLPPKYCEKRHTRSEAVDLIEEGWGKRYYKEAECSELCVCHAEEKLTCNVLECVEPTPCETVFAVYTHAAPAYQASRGECFCYSGSFICVRPPIDKYKVDNGVFLFLGYSEAEEKLLQPYTKVPLVDAALGKLGDIVRQSALIMNGTECRLEEVIRIGENIIMQAKLEEYDDLRENMTAAMLHREKEECVDSVAEVSKMINTHEKEVREDMALSVLILAEMQVHMPPLTAAAGIAQCPPLVILTTIVFMVLLSSQQMLLAS